MMSMAAAASMMTAALTTGLDVAHPEVVEQGETSSSSTSSASAAASEKEKRLWGSKNNNGPAEGSIATDSGPVEESSSSSTATHDGDEKKQQQQEKRGGGGGGAGGGGQAKDEQGVPFLFKPGGATASSTGHHSNHNNHNNNIHFQPPQGFRISSRVYTDPKDKLAHFDNDSAMVFPYWECGTSGSTTVPIPLQHASVRNLLGGSQPNTYSGSEFGPYPQLVVALSPVDIVLNSGQVQTFQPGDVILLEDVVSCGHKLKGHDHQDMTVMILTLTEHYHQVGKDKTSLQKILTKDNLMKISPCPNNNGLQFSRADLEPIGLGNKVGQLLRRLQPRSIRRYLLTVLGLSVSAVMGDFMGKVAPLWLAVLFGGGCFVTGGTLAIVKVGDKALDELEMWQERRQLRLQGPDTSDDPAGEDFLSRTAAATAASSSGSGSGSSMMDDRDHRTTEHGELQHAQNS